SPVALSVVITLAIVLVSISKYHQVPVEKERKIKRSFQ
ncbi:MAG: hypothetical protein ACI9ES_001504, partial [Oceanospirillaceae bacterium]